MAKPIKEDTPSTEDYTKEFNFQLASMEYKEICQNIRESWTYITTLIRQFFVVQILLISLVGLGNSSLANILILDENQTAKMVEKAVVSAMSKNADILNKSNVNNSVEEQNEIIKRHRKIDANSISVGVLIVIGFVFSWAAYIQSGRLFSHASKFVQRAAAIEGTYSIGNLGDKEEILPHHIYMNRRLDPLREGVTMRSVLSSIFVGASLLWVFYAFLFLKQF